MVPHGAKAWGRADKRTGPVYGPGLQHLMFVPSGSARLIAMSRESNSDNRTYSPGTNSDACATWDPGA
jgi:hypothetical protein